MSAPVNESPPMGGKEASALELPKKSTPEKKRTRIHQPRVLTYGSPTDHVLEAIAAVAAIGSGVALAMVNVVMGRFVTLLNDFDLSAAPPPDFTDAVQTTALYFIYIAIVRFVCIYVYSSLFTHSPPLMIVLGIMAAEDGKIEANMLKSYGRAGRYAENILAGVRTVHAFNLRPRVLAKYDDYLTRVLEQSMKKSYAYGGIFGTHYSLIFAAMAFAFWQGIAMIDRGEVKDIGVVFTKCSFLGHHCDRRNHVHLSAFDRLWTCLYSGRPNEPVLFDGTVLDNIANGLIGTPWQDAPREIQMEHIQQAAKKLSPTTLSLTFPKDMTLAWGKEVASYPILLLDEATSALDPAVEGIIQRALDAASKNRTTIVIAHKLLAIRNADNIIILSQGEIKEQDRHDELVARDGLYAALVKAQHLSTSEPAQGISASSETCEKTDPLTKRRTLVKEQPASLQGREDYSLCSQAGAVVSVMKLVMTTLDLKYWYLTMLLTCAVGSGAFPGQALLLGSTMDVFTAEGIVSRGNFIALMFFIMALGSFVVYFILGFATNVISQALNKVVRHHLLEAILRQDIRFFDRPENSVGALTTSLGIFPQEIKELMGFNIALIIVSILTVLACGILSICISWKLSLVGVFAIIPPMILAGYARVRLEGKMNADAEKMFLKSSSVGSEGIMAIRTVSSLAMENRILQRYASELDAGIRAAAPSMFHMMVWSSLTKSVEYLILALGFCLWWGSKLMNDGSLTFYQFMVSFMSVYFSGQQASAVFAFASGMSSKVGQELPLTKAVVQDLSKAQRAINYYFWLQNLEPIIAETSDNKDEGPDEACGSCELQDVHFTHPSNPNNSVLNGLALEIKRGDFIALVGSSSCGKTTVVSLLERFYDPTTGCISVDSTDLATLSLRLYRNQVALVQQEPSMFPGTIREAVSHGKDMVIDETAALIDNAETSKRITVAIAHSLSTIRNATQIYVLEGGVVAEAGAHGGLIGRRFIHCNFNPTRDPDCLLLPEACAEEEGADLQVGLGSVITWTMASKDVLPLVFLPSSGAETTRRTQLTSAARSQASRQGHLKSARARNVRFVAWSPETGDNRPNKSSDAGPSNAGSSNADDILEDENLTPRRQGIRKDKALPSPKGWISTWDPFNAFAAQKITIDEQLMLNYGKLLAVQYLISDLC
ncbi:hypothetical protein ACJZ2D_007209 [Fusarium nematophilum]